MNHMYVCFFIILMGKNTVKLELLRMKIAKVEILMSKRKSDLLIHI